MRAAVFLSCLVASKAAFSPGVMATAHRRSATVANARMGLFDGIGKAFGKAFSNNDYSQSPGLYAQTRAQARHVLVSTEEQALSIKQQIADGASFEDMARQYSSCNSKTQGGNLGSFTPKTMVPEFDEVVFDPDNELNEVLGPVATKFGYHLIRIAAWSKWPPWRAKTGHHQLRRPHLKA